MYAVTGDAGHRGETAGERPTIARGSGSSREDGNHAYPMSNWYR